MPTLKRKTLYRGKVRHVDPIHPGLEDKTQAFVKTYVDAMKELFPKPAEAPMPWNPQLPIYSVTAVVNPRTDTERLVVNLRQVSPTVADKAAGFCSFLALELRPGEEIAVIVERHEDISMNMANPVIMPVPIR